MSADVAEALKEARSLIADPDSWTQGYYARTEDGDCTTATNPAACRWCAIGAVKHVTGDTPDVWEVVDAAALQLSDCARVVSPGRGTIINTNDHTDHDTVLRVFDCAIAKAGA